VTRQVDQLHRELDELHREASALRGRVAGSGPAPDVGPLCARARRLLDCLGKYNEEEARVILDSINTDIGAGD
jgi:hypothetical protein